MASAEEAKKAMLSVSSMVKEVIAKGGKNYAREALSEIGRLFEKAGEPRQLEIIERAGHRLRREPDVIQTILKWLAQYRG